MNEQHTASSRARRIGEGLRIGIERAQRRIAERNQSSPYLVTPPRRDAPDGYRPPYQLVPEAFDHEHALDTYSTADDHEIVYCTLCGTEW